MSKIFREGMQVPQDPDGGSAGPTKPKKKGKTKPKKLVLPPLRKGEKEAPSDPDDGSIGMKAGGSPDGKMMKDSAHKDAKKDAPMMQKVAARAVKGHEKRMHTPKKMAHGGSIDGCAVKGKTRGRTT